MGRYQNLHYKITIESHRTSELSQEISIVFDSKKSYIKACLIILLIIISLITINKINYISCIFVHVYFL